MAGPLGARRARPVQCGRRIAIGVGLALPWLLVMATSISQGASESVAASDFVFTPDVVTIALGDTVTWTFAGEPHTVTSGTVTAGIPNPDSRFDSGIREPGQTYVLGPGGAANPFTSPGTYPYYCAVHAEQMTGTIVVQAAATPPATLETSSVPQATPAPSAAPVTPAPAPSTQAPPRSDPTPAIGPSESTSGAGGALIAGLVVLGALAVGIGLLVRQGRSGGPRPH